MSDAPEEAVPAGETEPIGEPFAHSAADLAGAPADDASPEPSDEPTSELPAEPAEPAEELADPLAGFRWPRGLQATATRRALLFTALGGLIIAGLVTAVPAVGTGPGLAGYIDSDPVPSTGTRSNAAFNHAVGGDCLTWPDGNPDAANIVSVRRPSFRGRRVPRHADFPRLEYGPSAAPRRRPHSTDHPGTMRSRGGQYMGPSSTPTASSASACCGPGTVRGASRATAACCAGCSNPALRPADRFQGQGCGHRPVQGLARRHLFRHRLGYQPADRCSGRLRSAARHGGDRHGQPGGEVPHCPTRGTGAGWVHQGLVHQDDRRLPRAHQVAHHYPHADLSHRVAAKLGGRQVARLRAVSARPWATGAGPPW